MMEPRSQVMAQYAQDYVHTSGASWESYAAEVVAHYHARTPAAQRAVRFHSGGDAYHDMRANGQIVRRMLDGTVKLPADLEEALVLALPDDLRRDALRDLAARYGLLAAPLPLAGTAADVESIGILSREFGEVLQAMAPALADGRLDAHDLPHLQRAADELADLMGQAMALRARMQQLLRARGVIPLHKGSARHD